MFIRVTIKRKDSSLQNFGSRLFRPHQQWNRFYNSNMDRILKIFFWFCIICTITFPWISVPGHRPKRKRWGAEDADEGRRRRFAPVRENLPRACDRLLAVLRGMDCSSNNVRSCRTLWQTSWHASYRLSDCLNFISLAWFPGNGLLPIYPLPFRWHLFANDPNWPPQSGPFSWLAGLSRGNNIGGVGCLQGISHIVALFLYQRVASIVMIVRHGFTWLTKSSRRFPMQIYEMRNF